MYADIILPLNLPQKLTYGVPIEMEEYLLPGMRVEVALGKNKVYAGIVDLIHTYKPENYLVKPIRSIIDAEPIVNQQQLQFWKWISNYYIAMPGEVMQAALPAHLKLSGETKIEWIAGNGVDVAWSNEAYLAAEALLVRKALTMTELTKITGARHVARVINELLEQEVITINDALETTYKPKKEKIIRLADFYKDEKAMMQLFSELERAPKQLAILMGWITLAQRTGFAKQNELLDHSNATPAQLKSLCEKGILLTEEINVDRLITDNVEELKKIEFTEAQNKAWNELEQGLEQKNVALLHGVTGSGKTLLYIHKIRKCIADGKQAIMMVPEIALTTQLVSRLRAYFGDSLGVYHSHFTNNERVEIWEKVRSGKYKVVVGPRSVSWLPYTDLGLIIVDEEHDTSYKQREPAPRFQARDAAIYLASLYKASVILGSATPSVESLYNVQQGKYAYAALKDRYLGVQMPLIEIVNAKSLDVQKSKGIRLLTPQLQEAMVQALGQKKQVILFQNKRGYTPFMMCTSCGWVPQCTNCSVSMTYHKSTDKLHCHYCGQKAAVVHTCPACGYNRMSGKSFGTEKIEEEVQEVFPKARVARMDVDSMRGKNSVAELLDKMEKGKIDILVGTQMVVKGLDLASVSLVGILSADSLLGFPDFRVNERAFQLMEQVSGRSGRTDGKGRVLIQAYNTQHQVLQWVKDHDVQQFYRHEIHYRENFAYPPFSRLIKIIFRHKDEPKAIAAAQAMAVALNKDTDIVVQGPGPAIIPRVRNQYIHEIWLKCPRDPKILDRVKSFLRAEKQRILAQRGHSNVFIVFDVDPM